MVTDTASTHLFEGGNMSYSTQTGPKKTIEVRTVLVQRYSKRQTMPIPTR